MEGCPADAELELNHVGAAEELVADVVDHCDDKHGAQLRRDVLDVQQVERVSCGSRRKFHEEHGE